MILWRSATFPQNSCQLQERGNADLPAKGGSAKPAAWQKLPAAHALSIVTAAEIAGCCAAGALLPSAREA
jgi:hypothetical protein